MPVEVRSNPYHPTRDTVVLTEPWTADDVRSAALANPRPVAHKAIPGTSKHRRLVDASAVVYQSCPPLEVDASSPAVRDWAEQHATHAVTDLTACDMGALWTTWYEVIHRGWAPTAPWATLRTLFESLVAEIDPHRSFVCRVEGLQIAAAFSFPGDDPAEILTEAVAPLHLRAREAVASCMAHALRAAQGVIRFDGHVSDPHFYPLLLSLPGVYAGESDPLDLLEIDPKRIAAEPRCP